MMLEGNDFEGCWLALVVDATARARARVSVATVESRAHRVQSGGSFVPGHSDLMADTVTATSRALFRYATISWVLGPEAFGTY